MQEDQHGEDHHQRAGVRLTGIVAELARLKSKSTLIGLQDNLFLFQNALRWSASMVDTSKVTYARFTGAGDFDSWLAQAFTASGVPDNHDWQLGMKTLCTRESSLKPNAINTYDRNATGANAPDGHPANCSRGIAQCIPTTFAQYHADGTSWNIYDPVANIAASIKYARGRYGVLQDGSNLAQKIRQADPHREPGGYIVLETV